MRRYRRRSSSLKFVFVRQPNEDTNATRHDRRVVIISGAVREQILHVSEGRRGSRSELLVR